MPQVDIIFRTIDNTTAPTKKVVGSFTELNSAISLASKGMEIAKKVYAETVGETLNYANSVRQLSTLSGQSTEATSKFIQVIDDYKLSADDALLATKALTKNGHAPSIETLAKLSDEYLSLNGIEEKNAFVLKNLGKGGLEWVEVLNKGSKALLAQGDAVNKNLILSQKAVKEAREYELALDDLNDQVLGLKISIGQQLIPQLTDDVFIMTHLNEVTKEKIKIMKENIFVTVDQAQEQAVANVRQRENTEAVTGNEMALHAQGEAMREAAVAAEENAEAMEASSAANAEYLGVLGSTTDQLADYEQQHQDIKKQQYELRQEMNKLISLGYDPLSEEVVDLQAKYDDLGVKTTELAATQEKASRRMILSMLEQELAIDGLDSRETDYLVKKGVEWGIYSETAIAEIAEARREVAGLVGDLNNLPTNKSVSIDIFSNYTLPFALGSSFGASGSGPPRRRDSGGPGAAGQSYLIGQGAQPELFTPSTSGTFTPNADKNMGMDYKKLARVLRDTLAQAGG